MQQIVAVLAPSLVDATPEQQQRAQRAVHEQMMLLARGYSVDSTVVRCAAELVTSALTPQPAEFVLASTDAAGRKGYPSSQTTSRASAAEAGAESSAKPAWQKSEGYQRYLSTILSSQPS